MGPERKVVFQLEADCSWGRRALLPSVTTSCLSAALLPLASPDTVLPLSSLS